MPRNDDRSDVRTAELTFHGILLGAAFASVVVAHGSDTPLALVESLEMPALLIGLSTLAAATAALYRFTSRRAGP